MAWVAVGGAVIGAVGSAYASNKAAKSAKEQQNQQIAAQKEANKMDPRIEGHLFGNGGSDPGMINNFRGMFGTPQNAGIGAYESNIDRYLGQGALDDTSQLRNTAYSQMTDSDRMAPQAQAAQINAPAQNGVATQGAFDRFINGDAGANPYLNQSINGAMAQSTNVFNQMQNSATENLKEDILPGIRSNSVLAGQYGGSRQGVAEGNAIGDFAKAQQQAINQFGQNNTNAGVGAQSQAFNQGQDRALAATTNLSGQQYGAAATNAGFDQQAGLANLGTQMQQQGMNDARTQTGAANLSGLIGTAYNTGQNHDSYDLNRAGKVNSLLGPYMNQSGSGVQIPQPLYSNTAGNVIGGAMAGWGFGNQISGMMGRNSYSPRSVDSHAGYQFQPTALNTNTSPNIQGLGDLFG